MLKYGVIDLGTNTFHLLIVREENGRLHELARERVFVKLAEDGIDKIGAAPFQRGLNCLLKYKQTLDQNQVTFLRAIGTAALRTASNGLQFINEVKAKTGINIEVVSGNREAQLIHQGVSQAVPLEQAKGLIMDIGGGSVEFIIANQKEVFWAQSFPIGVAVLFQQFHRHDPISTKEIKTLTQHLTQVLKPLQTVLKNHRIQSLIGASGTFDVIETFLAHKATDALYSEVPIEQFFPLKDQFINTSLAKRLQMVQLPASRAEMIIVALLLIDFVIQKAQPQQIVISSYAMKEGMLQEMIRQQKEKPLKE